MKTLYSIILLLLSFSSSAQYRYSIEAKFDTDLLGDSNKFSIRDGDLIYLEFISSSRTDTIRVKNKMFRFEGESSMPEVAMLSVSLQKYGTWSAFSNLILLDSCHYDITYTQTADEYKRVFYEDVFNTNSNFYHLWKTISLQKGAYLSKEKELLEMLESVPNAQSKFLYEQELAEVRKGLDDLYKKAAREHSGTYEMTYLLPADPYFSYERYINFYNELPKHVQNSFYGKNFYRRLLMTKP